MTDWLLRITFTDGESRYFESADAATHVGYTLRDDRKRVVDFEIEEHN
jgi:hypothetical protein